MSGEDPGAAELMLVPTRLPLGAYHRADAGHPWDDTRYHWTAGERVRSQPSQISLNPCSRAVGVQAVPQPRVALLEGDGESWRMLPPA